MARKTIKQRIELDGGKEILETLKGMGRDGERAFKQIEAAAKAANGPGAKLSAAVKDLRAKYTELARAGERVRDRFNAVRASSGALVGSLKSMVSSAALAVGAFAGLVAGLVKFVQFGTQAADAAQKQASALGLAIDEYGRLQFAAEQGGVGAEGFATAITRLNVKVQEAAEGGKSATEAFRALKVRTTDAAGNLLKTEDILGQVADAFARMPDGAEKSALAVDLFGRTGALLIPTLNAGAKGLRELGAEAEALGLVFTDQQANAAVAFNDSLNRLGRTARAARDQVGLVFAPALTEASDALTALLRKNRDALLDMARRGLDVVVPLLGDLIALLEGRPDLVQNSWILELRDQVANLASDVRGAVDNVLVPVFDVLVQAGELAAGAINAVFGTDLTGREALISAALLRISGAFTLITSAVGLAINIVRALIAGIGLIGPAIGFLLSIASAIGTGIGIAAAALTSLVSIPALIVAAVVAAVAAIIIYWDEISAAAGSAFAFLGDLAGQFGEILQNAFAAGIEIAGNLVTKLLDFGRAALAAIGDAAAQFGGIIGAAFARVREIAANVMAGVRDLIVTSLSSAFDAVADVSLALWTGFRNAASSAIAFVERQVARLKSVIATIGSGIRSAASSAGSSVRGALGFARGGKVRGPGSETSDSILAWLSNNEFVVKARAVGYYGADLLEAINSMRLPKNLFQGFATGGQVQAARGGQASRLALPKFSIGGLVDAVSFGLSAGLAPVPTFAGGGLAKAEAGARGRPVSISLDGQRFDMTADEDVAERLARHASRQRFSTLGPRPSWSGR